MIKSHIPLNRSLLLQSLVLIFTIQSLFGQEPPLEETPQKLKKFEYLFKIRYLNFSDVLFEYRNTEERSPTNATGMEFGLETEYALLPKRLSLTAGVFVLGIRDPHINGTPLLLGGLKFYFTDELNTPFLMLQAGHSFKLGWRSQTGTSVRYGIGCRFKISPKMKVNVDVASVFNAMSLTSAPYRTSYSVVTLRKGLGLGLGLYF